MLIPAALVPMVLTQKPDPGPASEEQGQSCGTQAALGRVLTDRGLGEAGGRVETAQKRARILERVAISSSRGSSQLRDRTWDFCIAGRFL